MGSKVLDFLGKHIVAIIRIYLNMLNLNVNKRGAITTSVCEISKFASGCGNPLLQGKKQLKPEFLLGLGHYKTFPLGDLGSSPVVEKAS